MLQTPRGWGEVGARKPPANKRIYDEAPVRKLHTCKKGDLVWNTITETVDQAANLFSEEQFHHLHCDRKRRSYPSPSSPARRQNLRPRKQVPVIFIMFERLSVVTNFIKAAVEIMEREDRNVEIFTRKSRAH